METPQFKIIKVGENYALQIIVPVDAIVTGTKSNPPEKTHSLELYNEKTTAGKLGISLSTLRRKRKAGLIGYVENGSRPFYRQHHLDEYLKEKRLNGRRI